jgi:hypothetical protein
MFVRTFENRKRVGPVVPSRRRLDGRFVGLLVGWLAGCGGDLDSTRNLTDSQKPSDVERRP